MSDVSVILQSVHGGMNRSSRDTELAKAAREALGRAALAAVALVIAVYLPVPMWGKIMIFFTVLFVAGIVIRVRKARPRT